MLVEALAFVVILAGMAVSAAACEGVGGPELTTLTTSLSGEGKEGATITVLEGSKVKDKATLKGKNASSATGKVTYKVYSESECKTLVKEAGEVTVSGESVPASSEVELEGGASYYWQAHYGGDSKNGASTSECTEIVTVKAKTSLSTKLSGESKEGEELATLEGSKVKDKATLSGTKSSSAGGKVLYKVYSDNKCEHLVKEAGEVTVSSGSVPASSEVELEGGETYYWQAHYTGDSLHQESTGACGKEVLDVEAKTSLSTKLSGESKEGEELATLEGSKVKDKATLSGTNSSTAGGHVTYEVYSDSKCEHLVGEAGEETVISGSVPASSEEELEGGKTYYWQAHYSGDGLHEEATSACGSEILDVKAETHLSTMLAAEGKESDDLSVTQGSSVIDDATLEGTNVLTAGGKVTYKIYSDGECKDLVAEAGKGSVSSGVVAPSEEQLLSVGTYYWQASYTGDSLHEPSMSACGDEVATVKSSTTLTTTLTGEGGSGDEVEAIEGHAITDRATLSGDNASMATGKVTYNVYSDSKCEHLVAHAGEVSVSGEFVADSEEEELEAGIYYWQAVYSGDSLNKGSTSACGSEIAIVKSPTSLTTSLESEEAVGEGEGEGAELEVNAEAVSTDGATLSGKHASQATGDVEYDIYSDAECKDLVAKAGTVSVTGGSVPRSTEATLEPGVYYWQATYSGDELDEASHSACGTEVLTVKALSSLTTQLSDGSESGRALAVPEGTSVNDSATLSGSSALWASGTVTYDIYAAPECKELVAEAGEVTVSGESVSSSTSETLPQGVYYWQARYSGDAINLPSSGGCDAEVLEVEPPLTTLLSSESNTAEELLVQEGAAVSDKATLNEQSASTASGTVTYNIYSDEKCEELVTKAGTVTVSDGEIPASDAETLTPGTYYWQAKYSGDTNHAEATSACGGEVSTVQTPTSIATSLTGEGESGVDVSVKAGAKVSDQATLSGADAMTAEGSVAYNVYSDDECKDLYAIAGDVEVSDGEVPVSSEEELPPGTYYWQAVYSGDETHHSSEGVCGSEVSTVSSPVTTVLADEEGGGGEELEIPEGEWTTDTATLHGPYAASATGTVSYYFYSNPECTGPAVEAGEVAVHGASVSASSEVNLEAGTYYAQADYSGDSEMPSSESLCTETKIEVNPGANRYAALGDSYSSGEGSGAGSFYKRSDRAAWPRNQCHRSKVGWPVFVAKVVVGVPATGEPEVYNPLGRFIFRACSGAVISNIWNGGGGNPEAGGQYKESSQQPPAKAQWSKNKPSQSSWLIAPNGNVDKNITLVTLTIGGNDVHFATIGEKCIAGRLVYKRKTCENIIAAEEGKFAAVEAALEAMLKEILARAPNADIRMPYYPMVVEANGKDIPIGPLARIAGWALWHIQAGIVAKLATFIVNLNKAINNAMVKWSKKEKLPARKAETIADTEQAFKGHGLGSKKPWTNGVILLPWEIVESFHPNPCGDKAIAAKVLENRGFAVGAGFLCP